MRSLFTSPLLRPYLIDETKCHDFVTGFVVEARFSSKNWNKKRNAGKLTKNCQTSLVKNDQAFKNFCMFWWKQAPDGVNDSTKDFAKFSPHSIKITQCHQWTIVLEAFENKVSIENHTHKSRNWRKFQKCHFQSGSKGLFKNGGKSRWPLSVRNGDEEEVHLERPISRNLFTWAELTGALGLGFWSRRGWPLAHSTAEFEREADYK